ncbi:MAG: anti-sigma factor antagonist [Candidatus Improbicoccus pseudotrichonymphae]|uniref:Anti-sigma factor antagonist n=1 Tax=Candidatus Improbicoccus pseudotrichonymphae TaxID=3033792 RepID=A0AA48HYW7_9FIRM|nr:MAG: anti-sigma factor antagonist [Candidatus Improbicoccus pseudotrichonymphae]
MEINVKNQGEDVLFCIDGRIDTQTAPKLQEEVDKIFKENKNRIVMDFEKVKYISSAGLRVILYTQKKINSLANESSHFEIINVNLPVKEVFDMTGFSEFLTITEKIEDGNDFSRDNVND